MLEIIAIYLTSKNIAQIAHEKGYPPGLWRFLAIITWILSEIVGAIIGILLFGQGGLMMYIFALGGAVLGYVILRKVLENKPQKTRYNNSDLLDN